MPVPEESSDIVAVTENDIDSVAESLGLMEMTADKIEDLLGTFFKSMHWKKAKMRWQT